MCFDQIPRLCRLCGHAIPMGTTWHGQHIGYYEWLEQYGNICVYCEHDRAQASRIEEQVDRLRKRPQRRRG
jgi:hypothetical protein